MKPISVVPLAVLGYLILRQLLKFIYLWVSPRFLSESEYGPPKSKLNISIYYLLAIFLFTIFFLEELGVIDALDD